MTRRRRPKRNEKLPSDKSSKSKQGQTKAENPKIKRGENGGGKTREDLSQFLNMGVNEQEAFEGGLKVCGEDHHCVPLAHCIEGSNSKLAIAM